MENVKLDLLVGGRNLLLLFLLEGLDQLVFIQVAAFEDQWIGCLSTDVFHELSKNLCVRENEDVTVFAK